MAPARRFYLVALVLLPACALAVMASVVSPLLTLGGFLAAVLVGTIVASPAIGLYILIVFFLIQGSPLFQTYGVFAQALSVSDIVALLVLVGYGVKWIARGTAAVGAPFWRVAGPPLLGVTAYFAWAAASSMWSTAPYTALVTAVRGDVEAVALFGLFLLLLRDSRSVRRASAAYAIAGLALAAYTIVAYRSHTAYRGGLPSSLNANELSTTLALVPAFAILACARLTRKMRLIVAAATFPVIGFALVILASRGTFVDILVAIIVVGIISKDMRQRLGLVPVLLLSGGTFLILAGTGSLPSYVQGRIASTRVDNFGQRLPIWQQGLRTFEQRPLIGSGAEALENQIAAYRSGNQLSFVQDSAHNDFVRSLADFGLVGFVLLLAMLLKLARVTVTASGRNPASIAITTILFMSMSSGSFLSTHWMWVALGIVSAFGLAHRKVAIKDTVSIRRPDPAMQLSAP